MHSSLLPVSALAVLPALSLHSRPTSFPVPCIRVPMQVVCRSYICLSLVHMNAYLSPLGYLWPSHSAYDGTPLCALASVCVWCCRLTLWLFDGQ